MSRSTKFTCCLLGETTLAIRCGKHLLASGHAIRAIVTRSPDVQAWARANSIPVSDSLLFLGQVKEFDYLFSVYFFRILPRSLLELPRRLPINLHDSALPRYGGLHSTSWAILGGETQHGVTWHIMEEQVDRGSILKQSIFPIQPDETAFSLGLKCFEKAAETFEKLVHELEQGIASQTPQSGDAIYYGPDDKPKGNGFIDWRKSAQEIDRLVRALNLGTQDHSFASAKAFTKNGIFPVKKIRILATPSTLDPGTVVRAKAETLQVATGTNDVEIESSIPWVKIEKFEYLPAFDSAEFNQAGSGIHGYIEHQASLKPNHVALEIGSLALSYRELDERANQLAHFLRARGVSRNEPIGILMERSAEMIISILGILKAGCAYLPLDPRDPPARLSFLINHTGVTQILTQAELSEVSGYPPTPLPRDGLPSDIAYILYTSGSTGEPKGCVLSHGAVGNYIANCITRYPLGQTSKVLFKAPLTFDLSVGEIFWALSSGATLVIAEPEGHRDPKYLLALIREKKVTDLLFVPSLLRLLLEEPEIESCSSVSRVITIGEELTVECVRRFNEKLPRTQLINSYGPTEAAVACTDWICEPGSGLVPIGRPFDGCKIYILDEGGVRVPPGITGEIYIGGAQLAQGYWKDDTMTRERFIADPFSDQASARMYKTGDRGRISSDGVIEFLGRSDLQVKIRGLRVEPEEIEAALRVHPGVKQCAVVMKKSPERGGDPKLVAYFIGKTGDAPISAEDLKSFAQTRLPAHMIPSRFVSLESLPVSSRGKIDRAILQARSDELSSPSKMESSGDSPDDIEKVILSAWASVLKIRQVRRTDNYFALGGDSFDLIRVFQILEKHRFGLQMKDLYQYSTVAELAGAVRRYLTGTPKKSG